MVVAFRGWQGAAVLAGMLLATVARSQQAAEPQPEPQPAPVPQPQPQPQGDAQGTVTTLGEVRAIKPEDDQPLDLYRFKSPVQATPNRFSKTWSEPPTPEQVGMSGGYLMMGIYYGVGKAAQGLHKLTGGPDQIQSAIARPPPELDAEQKRRALQFCAQQEGCAVPPDN